MKSSTIFLSAFSLLSALSFTTQQASAQPEVPASYATCSACHQATGNGLPGIFPPLAGSEWVNGPVENLIRIQLRGLMGEIMVKGQKYNSAMPPNASLSDDQIAEVLTYIRSSWGNTGSAVTPDMVKALRSEVGQPMLNPSDLIDPNTKPKVDPSKPVVLKSGDFIETVSVASGLTIPWYAYAFVLVSLVPVVVRTLKK